VGCPFDNKGSYGNLARVIPGMEMVIMRQTRTPYLIVALIGLAACDNHSPTLPTINAAATGSEVTVSAAVPDSATQDTTLDVTISGSGFASGADAQWGQGGVPSPSVRTNSTRFVSSRKLIANITIAADAATGLYDVIVTNLSGKKGIGTELFAVKRKPTDSPLTLTLRDAATDGIVSDAQVRAGDPTYIDGIDDVRANITGVGGYLFLDVRVPATRQLCLDFHGQAGAPYSIVCDNGYATTNTGDPELLGMGVGTTATTRFGVVWVKDGYNWSLKFGKDCGVNILPDRRASVTRVDGATWVIESPSTRAFLCRSSVSGKPVAPLVGEFFMPMQVVLRLK
jgi:hypothetical protein